MKRAIELSKQTAQREEAARVKEAQVESQIAPKGDNKKEPGGDDVDFGAGFEKFSTV